MLLYSCIDDSGGFLHHSPVRAGQIIVTCVCLHNIARRHNMPAPIPEEAEDIDGRRRNLGLARQQPERERVAVGVRPQEQRGRAAYIREQFGQ